MTLAPPIAQSQRAALFSAATPRELADALARGRRRLDGGPARAALFDPTEERLARARWVAERGSSWRGRDGMWFSPSGLVSSGGTLVFMFPGVDASFEPRIDDVAHHFGLPVPLAPPQEPAGARRWNRRRQPLARSASSAVSASRRTTSRATASASGAA